MVNNEKSDRKQNIQIGSYCDSYSYCSILTLFDLVIMAIPKLKPLAEASSGTKKVAKPILIAVIAILLVAFGLEASNTDFDLGKLLGGSSVEESKVARDESGNVVYFDKEGNVTSDSTKGKSLDKYNCDDFSTQPEAQRFYDKAGGVSKDVNRLDANKDGVPCESLPKGTQ